MEKNKQNESKVGGSVAEPSRKSKRGAGIAADPVESPPNESDRRRERIGKPISVSKQTRFDKLPPKKAAATVDEGEEEWEEAENGADKMIRSTEKRNVPSSLNMDREKSPGPGSGTHALDVLQAKYQLGQQTERLTLMKHHHAMQALHAGQVVQERKTKAATKETKA